MKHSLPVIGLVMLFCVKTAAQSYNQLWIPDTLSGTNFNLTIRDTFAQLVSGNQTITGGINGKFWGPTLFFNKGDEVHLHVLNKLNAAYHHSLARNAPARSDGWRTTSGDSTRHTLATILESNQ
jgi:FtsP/CotA-like multicopper oxidase with cupredoxin domain